LSAKRLAARHAKTMNKSRRMISYGFLAFGVHEPSLSEVQRNYLRALQCIIYKRHVVCKKSHDCFDADEQYGDAPFPMLLHRFGLVEK
jgi:hypothetical protein